MPGLWAFVFILLTNSHGAESPYSTSIRGHSVEPERGKLNPLLEFQTGYGSDSISEPRNALGLRIPKADATEILKARRPSVRPFHLLPIKPEYQRLKMDLSQDSSLIGQIQNTTRYGLLRLEGGMRHDRRTVPYYEDPGSPFDTSDDQRRNVPRRFNYEYGQMFFGNEKIQAQAEWEHLRENIFALSRDLGVRQARSMEGSFIYTPFRNYALTVSSIGGYRVDAFNEVKSRNPFAQIQIATPLTAQDQSLQSQAQLTQSIEKIYRTSARYQRLETQGQLEMTYASRLSPFYSQTQFRGLQYRDEARETGYDSLPADPRSLWEVGQEFQIELYRPVYFQILGRKYARAPTPTSRFGDGIALLPSLDLQPETGERLKIGPVLEYKSLYFGVLGFFEQSRNVPIQIASTPTQSRTVGLGGVWTRGAEVKARYQNRSLSVQTEYFLQECLNNSDIEAERGQRVPGRPAMGIVNTLKYDIKSYQLKILHRFSGAEAYDLVGTTTLPPRHSLDIDLGLERTSWALHLRALNLFQNRTLPRGLQFEGRAGTNVFQSAYQNPEYHLELEFML